MDDEIKYALQGFLGANEGLIGAVEDSALQNYLRDMDESYKEVGNFYAYAEVQIGLAKALDFLVDSNKMTTTLQNQVTKVVTAAYQLLQVFRKACTQNHEDGACLIGLINYVRVHSNFTLKTWPELPVPHALCFSRKIDPCILPKGSTIFRLIGKSKGTNKFGNWWLENRPKDRKSWRSDSAVSQQWNDGDQILEVTLDKELNVWRGTSASQAVAQSPTNCYLKGGEFQIWLDPDAIKHMPGTTDLKVFP
jgi:hypothetical protein